jgi:hypothetical protein
MEEGDHIDDETLALLVIGDLTGGDLQRVEAHLATGCSRCMSARASYEHVMRLARADRSVAPPPQVLARAVRIMPAQGPVTASDTSLWRRLRALPLFDSWGAIGLAGARGTESGMRQVLYGVEELSLEIDVQVRRRPEAPSSVDIRGQVFPRDDDPSSMAALSIELISATGTLRATTSPLGAFHVQAPRDVESLLLTIYSSSIEVPIPQI